uniref:Uncharacterized protein n=1 Tax=Lutzomyia longipalpis TaxID=7200 RepID=A0A1B0CAR9_LUTLO
MRFIIFTHFTFIYRDCPMESKRIPSFVCMNVGMLQRKVILKKFICIVVDSETRITRDTVRLMFSDAKKTVRERLWRFTDGPFRFFGITIILYLCLTSIFHASRTEIPAYGRSTIEALLIFGHD